MRPCLLAWMLLASFETLCAQEPVEALQALVEPLDRSSAEESRTRNSEGEIELRRFKRQAVQSVAVAGGSMLDVNGDGFNSSHLEFSIGSGIPLGDFTNILAVTPGARLDWIDAPPSLDIPDALYEFELQFFHRRRLRDNLSAMAIVSPSIRSDLTTSERALRVFTLGLLNWECVPDRLTLSAGAVYLGRADLPVLPAVGLSWTPSVSTTLDLQFPFSRFAHRLEKDGGESETWSYLSVGLGGNTWAVTRQSGVSDELSLRDFRITAGLQKLFDGGGNHVVEAGFALGRRLEYEGAGDEVDLGNGMILQAGWTY